MSTAVLDRRLNRWEIPLFNFVNYQHPRYSLSRENEEDKRMLGICPKISDLTKVIP